MEVATVMAPSIWRMYEVGGEKSFLLVLVVLVYEIQRVRWSLAKRNWEDSTGQPDECIFRDVRAASTC